MENPYTDGGPHKKSLHRRPCIRNRGIRLSYIQNPYKGPQGILTHGILHQESLQGLPTDRVLTQTGADIQNPYREYCRRGTYIENLYDSYEGSPQLLS